MRLEDEIRADLNRVEVERGVEGVIALFNTLYLRDPKTLGKSEKIQVWIRMSSTHHPNDAAR